MATEAEIIKQIEYYLSDANLERDEFFHKKISENEDGYIDIEFFLKCNKVKKMGITEEDIVKAMANSKETEVQGKQIRRKDNKALPALIKKKQKTEEKQEKQQEETKKEEVIEVKITKPEEPIVFQVTVVVNSASMHWKLLTEILQKSFDIKPIYIRYNKVNSEGNFILDKKTTDQALVDRILKEGIKVGTEFEAKISICNEQELEEFYNLHGSHYDNCIELQALNKTSFNEKRKKIAEKREKRKKNMIIFAGEKFFDISQLKNSFKGILGRTSNNDKIKEPYHEMLVELLKFHEKKDEKLQNLDHFTCDVHPVYNETRCFFVVRKDGSREDFSFTKCLVRLEEEKKKNQ